MARTSSTGAAPKASRARMVFSAIVLFVSFSGTLRAAPEPLVFFGDQALPPYEFLEDGKPKGANVDLARAIGVLLGRPVEIHLMHWMQAQQKLLAGEGHALTMLGKTDEREVNFDFTAPTLPVAFALFVRAGDEGRFGANNLAGKRIGVIAGGLPESYLGITHPQAIRVTVTNGVEGTQMLLRGSIDALAANQWSQLYLLRDLNISGITSLTPFIERTGNIAVRNGDAALLQQIEGALADLKESGEFDRIIDRWSSKRVHLFSDEYVQRVVLGVFAASLLLLFLAAVAIRLKMQKKALAHEIAERQKAEQEREQVVAALRQRERDLEESDRKKDEFISTMSHELRNPIAAIQYAVEMLRVLSDAAAQRNAREVIERQVAQLVHLVDDLLDVSRIATGKIRLRKGIVNLTEAIEKAVESHRARMDRASLRLSLDLPSAPLRVNGDATRLTQVIANLVDNAVKYGRPFGNIWIGAQRDGDAIALTVRDDGIGIPTESLPRVFDMFSQVDQERGRREDGLGIGLALVRKLVELHGGSVTVQSDGEDKGTTVVVKLPAAGDDACSGSGMSDSAVFQPEGPQPRAVNITIVEDNVDNAQTLKLLLESLGYDITLAYDGLEGVAVAEKTAADVMIVDIGLPDISGLEVARIVRRTSWGSRLPLIAVTGWGQENDREQSRQAGFDRHFTKPVQLVELQNALLELLQEAEKQEKTRARLPESSMLDQDVQG